MRSSLLRHQAAVRRATNQRAVLARQGKVASAEVASNLRKSQIESVRTFERLECARLLQLKDPVVRSAAAPPKFLEVPIAYATDRLPDADQFVAPRKDPYRYFTGKLDPDFKDFSFGTVTVSIPTNRNPGELNLPPWWKLIDRGNPDLYFQLRDISTLSREAVLRDLVEATTDPQASLLIFVHGFNVTFSEAALRTAQLAYDLSFPGKVLLYSWPSGGSIEDYWTDEDSARISAPRFAQLLKDLAATKIQHIHIVAHSMGTRIAIPSVARMRTEDPGHKKISQLVLAAADFNQIEFKELARAFADMRSTGTSVTIYAASNDFALKISKVIHSYRRLGESDPKVDIYGGLDSIDASTTAPMRRAFGHSYVSDSAQVLGDMQDVILKRLQPSSRGLEPIPNTADRGWRIPRLP